MVKTASDAMGGVGDSRRVALNTTHIGEDAFTVSVDRLRGAKGLTFIRKPMKIEVLVAGVTAETWFRETKDERQVTMLTCLDQSPLPVPRLKQTFEYQPTREEASQIDLTKLDGQKITVGIREVKPSNGGRLKMVGEIDRATLPKGALLASQAAPQPK